MTIKEATMALVACTECGGAVAQDAKACPHCGKKLRTSVVGPLVLTLLIAPFALCVGGRLADSSKPPPSVPGPSQDAFCGVLSQYTTKYERARTSGANQVVLSNLRAERRDALRALFGSTHVENWRGLLTSITTDKDGTARITVRLPCSGQLRSNAIGSDTAIERGTPLHQTLAALPENTPVEFSGDFYDPGDSRTDWLQEQSFTERGSMTDPEFIFAFSHLRKQGPATAPAATNISEADAQLRIPALQQKVAVEPTNAQAWADLGQNLYAAKRYGEAADALSRAVELVPASPDLFSARGVVLASLEQNDKAVADLEKALQLNPTHVSALYNVGYVYLMKAKQPEKGIKAWNKLVKVAPNSEQARFASAVLEEVKKKYPQLVTQ